MPATAPIGSARRAGPVAVGELGACSRIKNCGRVREEIFESLQVRRAAEKIVQHFILNVRHQLDKHVVGFGLVFDERILLRIARR